MSNISHTSYVLNIVFLFSSFAVLLDILKANARLEIVISLGVPKITFFKYAYHNNMFSFNKTLIQKSAAHVVKDIAISKWVQFNTICK